MKKAVILSLFFFGYQFLVSLFFVLINVLRGVPDVWNMNYDILSLTLLISSLLMAAHLIYFRDVRFGWNSLFEVPARYMLLCLPLVLSAMFFLNVVSLLLDLPDWSGETFKAISHNPVGVVSMVLVAPFVEELLFRGAIEGHFLKQGKSPVFAIVVSSLFFGVLHGNPAQMPLAFLIGLLLGWLYYRTGSIMPGVLCHMVNNGVAVATMLLVPEADTIDSLGGNGNVALLLAVSLVVFAVCFYYAKRYFPKHMEACQNEGW